MEKWLRKMKKKEPSLNIGFHTLGAKRRFFCSVATRHRTASRRRLPLGDAPTPRDADDNRREMPGPPTAPAVGAKRASRRPISFFLSLVPRISFRPQNKKKLGPIKINVPIVF